MHIGAVISTFLKVGVLNLPLSKGFDVTFARPMSIKGSISNPLL